MEVHYKNGIMHFTCPTPLEVRYPQAILDNYKERCGGLLIAQVVDSVLATISESFSEYVGSGFYVSHDFNGSAGYFGMMPSGELKLRHGKGLAQLTFKLHSEDRFIPVQTETGVINPTIDNGSVEGAVYLDVNTLHEEPRSYGRGVTALLMTSLLEGKPVSAQPGIVKDEIHTLPLVSGIYVPISHPTFPRMQQAVNEAGELSAYVQSHVETLKEAGTLVADAQRIKSAYQEPVERTFATLNAILAKARGELDPQIAGAWPVSDSLDKIQTHIDRKLEDATSLLVPLQKDCPRGLLEYVTR